MPVSLTGVRAGAQEWDGCGVWRCASTICATPPQRSGWPRASRSIPPAATRPRRHSDDDRPVRTPRQAGPSGSRARAASWWRETQRRDNRRTICWSAVVGGQPSFRRLARSNRYCSGTGRRTRLQVAPRSDLTTCRQAQRRSLDCSQIPRRRQPLHGRPDLRARDVARPNSLTACPIEEEVTGRRPPPSRSTARTSPAIPFWSSRNGYLWGDTE